MRTDRQTDRQTRLLQGASFYAHNAQTAI